MDVVRINLDSIVPYENNPRLNDGAVDAVKQSIEQVGYITPIIVDEDNVILAGHTRFKALSEMGIESAEVVVLNDLNEEQKKKFRILDNKTAELAEWDKELLKGELENLDLGDIHWFDDLLIPSVETGNVEKTKSSKPLTKEEEETIICCPRCGAIARAKAAMVDEDFQNDSEDGEE